MADQLEKFIAAGQRRKALRNPPRWTPAEHRAALQKLRALAEPCPFCGKLPALAPIAPWEEGNAFGLVECRNGNCAAQPKVSDESDTADERGPAAYIALAIRRWNRRPHGVTEGGNGR